MNIKCNEEKIAAIGKFQAKEEERNCSSKKQNEANQRRLARNRAENSKIGMKNYQKWRKYFGIQAVDKE